MERASRFITSESGFTYPLVVLIISVIFILFFKNVILYKQDITMTDHHIEQLNYQTLVQMTLIQIKRDLRDDKNLQTIHYSFPTGHVKVVTHKRSENEYNLELYVTTNKDLNFDRAAYIHLTN